MATVERGKGKRKQVIEVVQFGDVLRSHETDAGDVRLPGYRRFASETAAREALVAEVRAHLDAGMQPADDEARAIAASGPAKPAGPPALPIRQDLAIYNEATGFVVTSRKMAGKTLDEGSAAWKKAVTKGDMLPLSLIQDDPFVIRVVAGDPLTAQENAEWVARVDWHLNVPDGKLCITGGSVFTNEDYEDEDPHQEQFVGQLLVPKGHYRASLYSLARGLGDGASEPADEDEGPERVDFLLHLDPIEGPPKSGLSTLPGEGWFSGEENARKLDRASGLVAQDVIRPRDESDGQWQYVWRVFEEMPAHDRRPVKGDAVSVPLDSLARVAGIAWYGSRFTTIELRLTAPPGSTLDLSGEWPEAIVAVNEGGTGRIFYSNDLDINEFLTRLPALGARLAQLGDGTVLDLCSIATTAMPGSPEGAGMVSFRGVIRGGAWRIAQAYPEVDAATLTAAMAFVVEAEKTAPAAAIAQFAERFSRTWPVVVVRPEEPDEDDEDEGDGMFPTTPIKGAEIFIAPGGREYHQTMALLVSEKVAAEVQQRERALVSAGFKHVNDLVCSASEKIAYRGYAKAGGTAWAYFKVAAPDKVTLHIATTFANENDSFVTDVDANAKFTDGLAEHGEMIEVLAGQFGDAQPITATSKNFAETIEAVLLSA